MRRINLAEAKKYWLKTFVRISQYVLLSLVGIIFILPFVWMFLSSLKLPGEVMIYPPKWIPYPPVWSNYPKILELMPFSMFITNSFKVAILSVIGEVLTCSLAAYAFARIKFPGRNFLFFALIMTMMFPGQVRIIPVFMIMKFLGWLDTHKPLIVPFWTAAAFGTFLIRQFFLSLPSELEDAARIDGCSRFGIFWRIFVPLSKPILVTLAVFSFITSWNDLLNPVIYLSSYRKMTLTVGLAYFRGQYSVKWELLMAGATLSVIPILILYIVAQRYFVRAIVLSGLKG